MVANVLAVRLLKWPLSSSTTLLSGGEAHDSSAVVRVENTAYSVSLCLEQWARLARWECHRYPWGDDRDLFVSLVGKPAYRPHVSKLGRRDYEQSECGHFSDGEANGHVQLERGSQLVAGFLYQAL
jgi:hypothetical protein